MTVGELARELDKYDPAALAAVVLASDRHPGGAQVLVQKVGPVAGGYGAPGWVGLFAHDRNAVLAENGADPGVLVPQPLTDEDRERIRAALEQRHAGPDATRRWVSMRDWKFGERAEAALRQLAEADADERAGRDYALPYGLKPREFRGLWSWDNWGRWAAKTEGSLPGDVFDRLADGKQSDGGTVRYYPSEAAAYADLGRAAALTPADEPDEPHVVTT